MRIWNFQGNSSNTKRGLNMKHTEDTTWDLLLAASMNEKCSQE